MTAHDWTLCQRCGGKRRIEIVVRGGAGREAGQLRERVLPCSHCANGSKVVRIQPGHTRRTCASCGHTFTHPPMKMGRPPTTCAECRA